MTVGAGFPAISKGQSPRRRVSSLSLALLSCFLLLSIVFGGAVAPAASLPVERHTAGDGLLQASHPLRLWSIDPVTLDPALAGEGTSILYVMQLFSGLVRLDQELKPAPDIAERWEVSQDGQVYTFYLRRGVMFPGGKEVKAADFKYSWERALDPALGSQTASTYLGDISGAMDKLAGRSQEVRGVEVVDDFALRVTLESPRVYFLSKLTHAVAFVVDRANVEKGGDWWRHPQGTGPFQLEQWKEGETLVLARKETYYGDRPLVPQVLFYLSGVNIWMYERGEIDVTPIAGEYIYRIEDRASPFYGQMSKVPELSLSYIGFNVTRPPFDDVNVRRAFSMAVDKERIARLLFKGGSLSPARGILPPGMPGYDPGLRGLNYDVAEARRLIAQSRYPDVSRWAPLTITVAGWGDTISTDLAAVVQDWERNLGVKVTARQLEPPDFLYNLREEVDDMYYTAWGADYPDPQNFLEVLFFTDSQYNEGGYSSPEVDALLREGRGEADFSRRMQIYQEAERRMVDDAPALPLWWGGSLLLVKPNVKGYVPNALGYPSLSKVAVEAP